jgi:hypothetical protein
MSRKAQAQGRLHKFLREYLEMMTFALQAFENLYTDICEGKYENKSLKLSTTTYLSNDEENMKKSSSDSDNEYGMGNDADNDDDNDNNYNMHLLLTYGER